MLWRGASGSFRRGLLSCLVLAPLPILALLYTHQITFKADLFASLGLQPKDPAGQRPTSTPTRLRELSEPGQFLVLPVPECVTLQHILPAPTKICIKPLEQDKHVSGMIKSAGGWEVKIVSNVVRAMASYPEATFIDLGCNIGMYTVVVAAMQRQVVAVDADPHNLAYIRSSLLLGNNTGNVRLLYNAVSNEHTTLYPVSPDPTNEGNTIMYTKERLVAEGKNASLPQLDSVTVAEILASVPATTVIFKLDIQGFECKALQPAILLGESGKAIPFIFLEWGWLAPEQRMWSPDLQTAPCPEYKDWLKLFYSGGYSPFDPATLLPVPAASVDAIWDIVWVHSAVERAPPGTWAPGRLMLNFAVI